MAFTFPQSFLDIPELSAHGVEILKIIRKKYMDVLYTQILHNYIGSDIPEVYAATRVGHLLTLIASITVRVYPDLDDEIYSGVNNDVRRQYKAKRRLKYRRVR